MSERTDLLLTVLDPNALKIDVVGDSNLAYRQRCHISTVGVLDDMLNYGDELIQITYTVSWQHFSFCFGNDVRSVDIVTDNLFIAHSFDTTFPEVCSDFVTGNDTFIGALRSVYAKILPEPLCERAIKAYTDQGLHYHSETPTHAFSFIHDFWFPDNEHENVIDTSCLFYHPGHLELNNDEPLENMRMLWWCNHNCKGKTYFISSNWSAWTDKRDLVRFKLAIA